MTPLIRQLKFDALTHTHKKGVGVCSCPSWDYRPSHCLTHTGQTTLQLAHASTYINTIRLESMNTSIAAYPCLVLISTMSHFRRHSRCLFVCCGLRSCEVRSPLRQTFENVFFKYMTTHLPLFRANGAIVQSYFFFLIYIYQKGIITKF